MRFAQLVLGPAGTGKSTYCSVMEKQTPTMRRPIRIVNLDPAADSFDYEPLADVRDLITVEDVMDDEDLQLGPNGGLIYCMKYLLDNMDWLHEQIGEDYNDDYIVFDLPGQIEIYTHMDIMKRFIEKLDDWGFRTIAVYCLDANFLTDGPKFIAGSMTALSTMVMLEVPQINLITKMDLISKRDRKTIERFLEPDSEDILGGEGDSKWNKKYLRLTLGIGKVLDDFSLVKYFPLNIRKEQTIESLYSMIDVILGISEDDDVKIVDPPDEMDDEN